MPCIALAAGTLALAPAAITPVQAQACNSVPNPGPPPAITGNFANQSFGNNPPLAPYLITALSATGCAGGGGSTDNDGNPGSPGQPGAQINGTNTALTIIGAPPPPVPLAPNVAAFIGNSGGGGGAGGESGPPVFTPTQGGAGGLGGAGGAVTVSFDATFVADPSTGLGSNALDVRSFGGTGGAGGDTNSFFSGGKYGGDGGAGGAAGAITLTASGTAAAGISGVTAISSGGDGGQGANADSSGDLLSTATGGNGGSGGAGAAAAVTWTSGTVQTQFLGLTAVSSGGLGLSGGQATSATGLTGGNGGVGGQGGTASVTLAGGSITITQPAGLFQGYGIGALSYGGGGGYGGLAGSSLGSGGGNGGNGGAAGEASVTVLSSIAYTVTNSTDTSPTSGQAILVQSTGGIGGDGAGASGLAGEAGGGGFAGAGGSAVLALGNTASAATVRAEGNFAHGALVGSIGGGGGNGGSANFVAGGGSAGSGQAGGNGGTVTVTAPNASVIVSGPNSAVLIAHSVGGGGGAGGNAQDISIIASIAIGGNGGQGGNGGGVGITLGGGVFASTGTTGGAGILAQSVGGSGGFAGSASATGTGLLSMTVGGDAGGGGVGGPATINNGGLVTTYGDHAVGIQAQSIGGGGGKGGAAVTFTASLIPTAAIAIGGRGGGGGPAGTVAVTNTAQVTTYGSDAHGVLLQSIGGGGGSGGAAAARAVSFSPSKYIPAISISVATGGLGGAGNTGGTVTLSNSGLITTAGHGAVGVMAQSVGGGGGSGGDATAASFSGGRGETGLSISVAVGVGGAGGSGATGGQVTLGNAGLILTYGQDAYGVFAQSIGGGGGTGGGGDATSTASEAKFSFAASIGVGGSGGTGGTAGIVGLTNTGAITTRGDGSDGVFAQSVGGGGGAAGGGTATASGGTISVAVGVGGRGGAGGDGNAVTLQNSGSVVTRGTDAVALFAQSIGGGGGKGGKGGATAGGVSTLSTGQALFDTLSGGLNFGQNVTQITDQILQIGQIGENIQASIQELQGIFAQPQAQDDDGQEGESDGITIQVNVGAGIGGTGGAAGVGGTVGVTNTGQVMTFGAQSDGILAQSIGGGGGSGGAASSTGSASDDTPVQASVAVGGGGGAAGNGGAVTVTNGSGGVILTQGVLAMAIVAQSIGGGGGEGSIAGTVNGSLRSLGVGLGGNGGAGGDGGSVTVSTGDGTTASSITTTGKHGIGILAQSIGGGGGLVRSMTTDQTFDPSKIVVNPQGRIADIQGLSIDLGGQNGAGGDGGAVQVNVTGPITTAGLGAHGVVAQSIGGGGGFAAGGQFVGPIRVGGGTNSTGDGGAITIRLGAGGAISTTGDGAYGVLAQSIGGGGGVAGDPSLIGTYVRAIPASMQRSGSGTGGTVQVALSSASISTSGAYAPAIFAQSIGGGGGMLSQTASSLQPRTLYRGSTGGGGDGGGITVSLVGSHVTATGQGSAGILAQSTGATTGAIQISLDAASSVTGGQPDANPAGQDRTLRDAAAIRILGGTGNTITNAGTITALDGNGVTGFAILADSSRVTLTNTGTITGDTSIPTGSAIDNLAGGVIAAPTLIDLGGGVLRNAGALHVGGTGRIGTTVLGGNLVQSGSGRLVVETDHGAGSADRLQVQGSARLGGTVEVRPVRLANAPVTVLTATQGLALDPDLAATRTHLFRFDLQQQGAALRVQPAAEFTSATGAAGSNQLRVAEHLQQIWESGARFDAGFTALGTVEDAGGYGRALDTLSGQTLGAIAAWRFVSSMNFVSNMQSCPVFIGDTMAMREDECAWARVTGNTSTQNATGGSLGYSASAETAQIGRQWALAPNWFLGLSVGYESSRFTGDLGTSRVTGDALAAGVALKHQMGRWLFSATLDAGHGEYDSTRRIEVGSFTQTATASPNAWHVGGTLRASYQMVFEDFYLRPLAELRVIHVQNDGFTETGAGPFNLTVSSASSATVAGSAGVEFGKRIAVGTAATLHLYGGVGVTVLGDDGWAATARFADAPGGSAGFRATTPIPDVLGRLVVGANLYTAGNWEMRVQYNGDAGDDFTSHTGTARLAYRF